MSEALLFVQIYEMNIHVSDIPVTEIIYTVLNIDIKKRMDRIADSVVVRLT